MPQWSTDQRALDSCLDDRCLLLSVSVQEASQIYNVLFWNRPEMMEDSRVYSNHASENAIVINTVKRFQSTFLESILTPLLLAIDARVSPHI